MKVSRLIFITIFSLILVSCKKEQGRTDISACNFSPTAEENDGSCYSPGDDCDDNNESTINDSYSGSCNCEGETPSNLGCTDSQACNYNPNSDTNDGSCLYPDDPCNDNNSSTINDTYNSDCDCVGITPESGCMDSQACNYNPYVTTNDGSCVYPGDPCNDNNSNTINDTYNSNCDCVGTTTESGCTESNACNYNPNATNNDGSCVYPGDPCNDNNSNTINDTYNSNCDCVGVATESGCTDSYACNYNPNATTNDNSCEYPGDSCDDGDPSTSGDILNSNCDCVGTPPATDECEFNSDGFASVTFGIYTDNWPGECQYMVYETENSSNSTGWIATTTQNTYNESTYLLGSSTWTLAVEDSYGDGKGSNGFYYATCISTTGGTITLVETPFTTAYSSSTNFVIGTRVANPVMSDNN